MATHKVTLERIDSAAHGKSKLNNVLIVLVARRTDGGGQVIVGWYNHAVLFRDQQKHSPGKPSGYGHFCVADSRNCVLLPDDKRKHEVPFGKGAMGQSNVCYSLESDGTQKGEPWMRKAIEFIDDFEGENIFLLPQADAEKESSDAIERALARSKGQGFARTAQQRKALEDHSMAVAKRHYRKKGFDVDDVSDRCSYDLQCKRAKDELRVEVKGTTTLGQVIVLTRGEVIHASDHRNACALFILHSIRLNGNKASGGKVVVLDPWKLQQKRLKAIGYTYEV
jgi:hypothetical protein